MQISSGSPIPGSPGTLDIANGLDLDRQTGNLLLTQDALHLGPVQVDRQAGIDLLGPMSHFQASEPVEDSTPIPRSWGCCVHEQRAKHEDGSEMGDRDSSRLTASKEGT